MPEYTLKLRRYSPETGEAAYWESFNVELEPQRSVLEGILQARNQQDGSIGIRCSCRAAICGSCGVMINGKAGLACHTHLSEAARDSETNEIVVEPFNNMPVIKDLVVDMDAVHWAKQHRVTPWLINEEPVPEKEYIVPHENMVDVTQSMACIQCGCCNAACLSMEVDPLFVGPAALAKAYRFVGDPRDAQHDSRLKDLAEDPHGMYDCTHCFSCIDACPKGVQPMNQIIRLRRKASDYEIDDRNNGHRHEAAFVDNIKKNGLLHEADLLPDSYGGKFHPRAVPVLVNSLPAVTRALVRRKVTPQKALLHPHRKQFKDLKDYFEAIEKKDERYELNLYITGYEDVEASGDNEEPDAAASGGDGDGGQAGSSKGDPNKMDTGGEIR
jgi:succinate dehydrogenase / fumarate reductase, iron-sulfur subunit